MHRGEGNGSEEDLKSPSDKGELAGYHEVLKGSERIDSKRNWRRKREYESDAKDSIKVYLKNTGINKIKKKLSDDIHTVEDTGGVHMLLKYIVKNYKSIAHPIEYSMFPTEDMLENKYFTVLQTVQGPWRILRRGALLGPNASGKSNFIQSLDFARNYIVETQKSGNKTGIPQFKGKFSDIGKNSTFQFMFYQNEEVFEYGFTLDEYRVAEEWLMILGKTAFKPIFQRVTTGNDVTSIELSPYLGRKNSKKRQLAELLKETIKKNQRNQLFLYKLSENGFDIAENILEWFYKIQIMFPSSKVHMLEMRLMQNENFARFLSSKLVSYDTGINKIFAQTKKVQLTKLLKDMDIPQEIIDEISEKREGLVNINGRLFIFSLFRIVCPLKTGL